MDSIQGLFQLAVATRLSCVQRHSRIATSAFRCRTRQAKIDAMSQTMILEIQTPVRSIASTERAEIWCTRYKICSPSPIAARTDVAQVFLYDDLLDLARNGLVAIILVPRESDHILQDTSAILVPSSRWLTYHMIGQDGKTRFSVNSSRFL